MSVTPEFETAEEAAVDNAQIEPIHVVVDNQPNVTGERELTPEFGSLITYSWPVGTSVIASAQQIVPQNRKRHEAQILVQAGLGNTIAAPAVNQIPLAASGVASYNNNSVGVNQTITGGTVTAIAINGVTTGLTSGVFFVPAGGTVTVTYTVAPTTFTTAGIAVAGTPSSAYVQIGSRARVQNNQGAQIQAGMRVPYDNSQELWAASDGVNAMIISVLDERYR